MCTIICVYVNDHLFLRIQSFVYMHTISEDIGAVDCTIDLVVEFIQLRTTLDELSARHLRGPYLAQLELMRLLKDRSDARWDNVFRECCADLC